MSETAEAPDTAPIERRLVFDLASGPYGLRLETISGVAELSSWRAVPGAPRGILGLTEWRGHPLAVLDLPWLLREGHGKGTPSLVRLAAPFDHLALYVPASLRVEEAPGETEERSERLLEPAALVAAVTETRVPADDGALSPG